MVVLPRMIHQEQCRNLTETAIDRTASWSLRPSELRPGLVTKLQTVSAGLRCSGKCSMLENRSWGKTGRIVSSLGKPLSCKEPELVEEGNRLEKAEPRTDHISVDE